MSKNGVSLSELSKATGIAKGTLSPIVTTLVQTGYVQNDEGRLRIGRNCFKIGNDYVQSISYIDILRPHMREIVAACSEICQLGILDGGDVLYVDKVEPEQAIRIESSAGKTLPAYATALGKCLLSELDEAAVTALYPTPFRSYTPDTTPDLTALFAQLKQTREQGVAHEKGETNPEIQCVAVPVHAEGAIIASVSVSIPNFRATTAKMEAIVALLKQHGQEIEKEIALLPKEISFFPGL